MSSSVQIHFVLPPTTVFVFNKQINVGLKTKAIWPSDMHYLLGCIIILTGVC